MSAGRLRVLFEPLNHFTDKIAVIEQPLLDHGVLLCHTDNMINTEIKHFPVLFSLLKHCHKHPHEHVHTGSLLVILQQSDCHDDPEEWSVFIVRPAKHALLYGSDNSCSHVHIITELTCY